MSARIPSTKGRKPRSPCWWWLQNNLLYAGPLSVRFLFIAVSRNTYRTRYGMYESQSVDIYFHQTEGGDEFAGRTGSLLNLMNGREHEQWIKMEMPGIINCKMVDCQINQEMDPQD